MPHPAELKRIIEAALLASQEPLSLADLRRLFDEEIGNETLRKLLEELRGDWAERAVNLVSLASGWRFQTGTAFRPFIERLLPEKPPRYSRAVMETLAIIAYRQPVTRPEIEEIRGTSLSQQTLDALLEANLVAPRGRRESPGRPTLWGTTPQFLAQFGLNDLRELPRREDLLLEPL